MSKRLSTPPDSWTSQRWGASRRWPDEVLMLFQRGPSKPGSLSSSLLPSKPADPTRGDSEAKLDQARAGSQDYLRSPTTLYIKPCFLCILHTDSIRGLGSPSLLWLGRGGSSAPSTVLMKHILKKKKMERRVIPSENRMSAIPSCS